MGSILSFKAMSFHPAGKTHASAIGSSIDVLSLLKPIWSNVFTNPKQSILVPNSEFDHMPLWADFVLREMSQQWSRHIARVLPARANLNSIVSVNLLSLVRHDLGSIHLDYGAGAALARLCLIYGRHSSFDG